MDQETFLKLKKGNHRIKTGLCREYIRRTWFLCFHLTQDVSTAAPLLLSAWEKAFEETTYLQEIPTASFREIISAGIFKVFQGGVQQDEDFSALPPPNPAGQFQFLVQEIQSVPDEYRPVYIMNTYGGLGKSAISDITGLTPAKVAEILQRASQEIAAKRPKGTQQEWAEHMRLSAEFRSPTEEGFADIRLPPRLTVAIEKRLGVKLLLVKPEPPTPKKKRGKAMSTVIEKARKANPEALKTLYHANKGHILALCQCLLGNVPITEAVMLQVFKNSWNMVIEGAVNSEEEFSAALERKAINACKNRVLRQNNKAFKLPQNGNFANASYPPEKLDIDGPPVDVVLKNLPELCRFIYVLRVLTSLQDRDVCKLLNINLESIQRAMAAEELNIAKISASATEKAGENVSITVDEFHGALSKKAEQMVVSKGGNLAALSNIDSICEPVRAKARKRTLYIMVSGVAALVIVSIIAGVSLNNHEDGEWEDGIASSALSSSLTEDGSTMSSEADSEDENAVGDIAVIENPTHYADIAIQDYGTVTVALDGNTAPETVENFVSLAKSGFYDGLTFHRIMEGFMMQGGDPNGDGSGGSDTTITGEFSDNGIENPLSNTRGAIDMARSNDYNSASSQFFIVHEDSTFLDGQYAVFGYATSGMDIVDAICTSAEPTDNNGTIPSNQQPVITSVTIRDVEETAGSATSETSDAQGTGTEESA